MNDATSANNVKSIAAIAAECGVSAMTVSRALRSNTSVKESTRKRIMDVAQRLGYRHAIKAGRPASDAVDGQTRPCIDLVLGELRRGVTLFYSELLMSVERELSRNGFDCVVRTYGGGYGQFIELRDRLRHSASKGTIITGAFLPEELKALMDVSPRSALVDNPGDNSIGASCDSICFDNIEAARMAMRHLLGTGRRRIALVKGCKEHYFSREIELGYREVLSEAGVAFDENLVIHTDFSASDASEKLSAAIEGGLEFDAVFTNDEMACGVYRSLARHGLETPSDVAVCGCDGLPVGEQLTPSLTTIKLDYVEMGRLAVERILSDRCDGKPCRIRLLPELCVRESAAAKK